MKSLILWNANLILRKKILILLNATFITWNENLITFETKSALEYKSTLNFICICAPHHTNVCKISRLCGGAISSIVFNRSLSNLAILLIFIEKTVKGSVDCNFRIATGQKIGLGYREQPRQNTQTEPDQETETSWKFIKN